MATILTVDDDPILHRIIGLMLKRDNHVHVRAFSVKEALNYLQQHEVDMVIVDLMMPERSGISMLEELRSDKRFAYLPIVLLTASAHISSRAAAEEKGADAYLQKPISSRELADTIRSVLPPRGAALVTI